MYGFYYDVGEDEQTFFFKKQGRSLINDLVINWYQCRKIIVTFHFPALIGQLEATKLQNESMIQDLEGVVNKLRDKLSWLEKERENLERQKSDINQSQKSQLQSLEKV